MCSASAVDVLPRDDRATPARVRDAALACFAEQGVRATTVRAIAHRAGVSPALVIHHFGSKERLRAACDAFVLNAVRERKLAAMRAGPGIDPMTLLRSDDADPVLLAYLARAVQTDSPAVAGLVDELVADAETVLAAGVESGMIRHLDHPRGVAAVLTLWSLGALVLHDHVRRLLDADLTAPGNPDTMARGYALPALEILSRGLLTPGLYERFAGAGAASAASRASDREGAAGRSDKEDE